MPIDEVLMRDSCGKSRSKIKKYFYYNEYDTNNFPFTSDFEELTLLDLIEGTKSISDVIPLFVPSFILIILAIACIGIWISICVCSVKPKCFCKRDNKNTKKTQFICLMVFFGFALCIIVLGIVLLVYISNAQSDFNGTICSLLMFQYQIIHGQGFLAKEPMYKPYWYGSNGISENIADINVFLSDLETTCSNNLGILTTAYDTATDAGDELKSDLETLYNTYKSTDIQTTSPTQQNIVTIPKYIKNLGPTTTNDSYTGKVIEDYEKYFQYILDDILEPVTGLCNIISSNGGQSLTNGLEGFEGVIESVNEMMDHLSSKITEYIADFSGLIVNFGYKVNFALFLIIIILFTLQVLLYILYYFHPFALIKNTLYVFIHLFNFILIICFIYNGIFSILALLFGNMADIVDAVLSKENLSSETPRLIDAGEDINKLTRCLRGDGDLFAEFVTQDVKAIVDPLTQLYKLYTPVKIVNSRINNANDLNEYNHLIALDDIIEELTNMQEDFLLSTTQEISQNNDIGTMFDELNKYTMAGRRYQQRCVTATYDIWTTNEEHCTNVQADYNIITGNCRYLRDFYEDPPTTTGAETARDLYKTACGLINSNDFNSVKEAVYHFVLFFSEYKYENENLINLILTQQTSAGDAINGLEAIKTNFETNFINQVSQITPLIDEKITGKVHSLFSELLNDTISDTRKLTSDFNLFSWMNCTAIGQDYNATLSTLKSNLTGEMKVIIYCSLACEILIIATLYIMLGLNKNLRDKIFEINDDRNVSHSSDNVEEMEIDSNTNRKSVSSSEKNSDEIYNVKNKKNFQVVKDIDKRKGKDVKSKSNLDKDGKGIEHPVMVSINGPSGKPLFENGENGEMAHNKMKENKSYYKKNEETEEELTSSEGQKKEKKSKEKEKETTNGENEDEEGEEEEEDDEDDKKENSDKKSKKTKITKMTKVTKSKGKVSESNKKTNNKKEGSKEDDSFSFG